MAGVVIDLIDLSPPARFGGMLGFMAYNNELRILCKNCNAFEAWNVSGKGHFGSKMSP